MNKRQRKKMVKRANALLDEAGVFLRANALFGAAGVFAIQDKLAQSSVAKALIPLRGSARPAGRWKDDLNIVHAVNALSLFGHSVDSEADVDLGRETACGSRFWAPDERLLFSAVESEVDCMACIASRSCT